MNATNLDAFTLAYVEAALWAKSLDDRKSWKDQYTVADVHPDTLERMIADCDAFQAKTRRAIGKRANRAGFDFWLTRNGRSGGFADWELDRKAGSTLLAMSKPYGESTLYIGDDGMVHGS